MTYQIFTFSLQRWIKVTPEEYDWYKTAFPHRILDFQGKVIYSGR